jgi:hypothetical protein
MNFWIFAGVFSERNVRRFAGDKPKLSSPARRRSLFARLFNRSPRSEAKPCNSPLLKIWELVA